MYGIKHFDIFNDVFLVGRCGLFRSNKHRITGQWYLCKGFVHNDQWQTNFWLKETFNKDMYVQQQ